VLSQVGSPESADRGRSAPREWPGSRTECPEARQGRTGFATATHLPAKA